MKYTDCMQLNMTDCGRSLRVSFSNVHKPVDIMKSIKRKMKWREIRVNSDGEIIGNEENKKRSIRRARVSIVDLSTVNDFEYFGTITINGQWHDISNPSLILSKLQKWTNNYKTRSAPDFDYLICPEYGEKTSRLHFHFLMKGILQNDLFINEYKHLDFQPLKERFGHVQITKIRDTDSDRVNVAKYCAKYISKDNIQIRSHRYFRSNGLKKPTYTVKYTLSEILYILGYLNDLHYIPYSSTQYGMSFAFYGDDITEFQYILRMAKVRRISKQLRFTPLCEEETTPFD